MTTDGMTEWWEEKDYELIKLPSFQASLPASFQASILLTLGTFLLCFAFIRSTLGTLGILGTAVLL